MKTLIACAIVLFVLSAEGCAANTSKATEVIIDTANGAIMQVAWSPRGDKIAYEVLEPSYNGIFTYDLLSKSSKVLVEGGRLALKSWLPQGIMFYADGKYVDGSGQNGFWLFNENTQKSEFLIAAMDAALSKGGEQLAYSDQDFRLHIRTTADNKDRVILTLSGQSPSVNDLTWSPDANGIVFSFSPEAGKSSEQILEVNVATGEVKQITQSGYNFSPRISPNGKEIAFLRDELKPAPTRLLLMPWHGGCEISLPVSSAEYVDWAPDGKSLIFSSGTQVLQMGVREAIGETDLDSGNICH